MRIRGQGRRHAAWAALVAVLAAAPRASEEPGAEHALRRCMDSPARSQELAALERQRLRAARVVAAPAHYDAALNRLRPHARLADGAVARLVAIAGGEAASALSSGVILVSDRLWRQGLVQDEDMLVALLAHELAHLELQDAKRSACEAIAFGHHGDAEPNLADALRDVAHAIAAGDSMLAVELAHRRYGRQWQADLRAAELLEALGIPRTALGRLLVRIAAVDGGDYTGSSPAIETRLENLGIAPASVVPAPGR
jgi:Zn-dependent protease with chaperone function